MSSQFVYFSEHRQACCLPRTPLKASGVRFGVRCGLGTMSRPVSDAQQSLYGNQLVTYTQRCGKLGYGHTQDCSQTTPFRERLHEDIM